MKYIQHGRTILSAHDTLNTGKKFIWNVIL